MIFMQEEHIPKSWLGALVLTACFLAMTMLGIFGVAAAVSLSFGSILDVGPNGRFHEFSQLLYNFTNSALILVALIAFLATRRQLVAAEQTRLATLYAHLESRWSSELIIKGRAALVRLMVDYGEAHPGDGDIDRLRDYIDRRLNAMYRASYEDYATTLSVIDFFEFVALIEARGYMDIADIEPVVGGTIVSVYDLLSVHLRGLIDSARAQRQAAGFAAPDDYVLLAELVEKFRARFKSAAAAVHPGPTGTV